MLSKPPQVEFSVAFQPIVDAAAHTVLSHEALIRGPNNTSALDVLRSVRKEDLHRLDLDARVGAIAVASRLGITTSLNLNFLPRSLNFSEQAIAATLEAAQACRFPVEDIILEVTEGEVIDDPVLFARILNRYRGLGMKVAIDDFGAGYSGLTLLADFQPDMIKLDMNLVRGIDSKGPRQSIVRAIHMVCRDLGIAVIAEGVETMQEYLWFKNEGVELFQGYLFAKPGFESFPMVCYPD